MNIDNRQNNLPKVSIIVPAYNAQDNMAQLIESLLNQKYTDDLLEIIIVDNNSNDQTRNIIRRFPVKLIEKSDIQSSYAARNEGIKNAAGDYLAFIDADCIATDYWLSEGVNAIISESADLAAGKVEFYFSKEKTAAEMYDSITQMQSQKTVTEKKAAATANIFVKASLFQRIGFFPEVTSGADVTWTKKAAENGFKLIYADKAIVKHPARNLKQFLKKRFRTGAGTVAFWKSTGVSTWWMCAQILRRFLPRRLSMIKKTIQQRGTPDMNKKIFGIWLVAYLCNLVTAFCILTSILSFSKRTS
jgi:glycosyltransferase involved in cell wall biosynthesis